MGNSQCYKKNKRDDKTEGAKFSDRRRNKLGFLDRNGYIKDEQRTKDIKIITSQKSQLTTNFQ
jgi:hypothetical protein